MNTSKTLKLIALSASVLSLTAPLYAFANTATHSPSSETWKGTLPIAAHGPFQRIYMPQNVLSAANRAGFPREWTSAYANAQHNAAFPVGNNAPKWLRQGVGWNFAEARAWPLSDKLPFGNKVYGEREALPVQTQFMGNALGVTAVDGIIYGESDDMFAYAVNARTGQLIWRASPVQNNLMGDPVVAGNSVYLSAGSVSFNFAHVIKYAKTGKTARGEDESFNGVISLNKNTGKFQWLFFTKGEAMPTPAYADGTLYVSTGAGNIFAIDAKNGQKVWKTHVGGIANMSDPVVYDGRVYVSMSVVPYLYCLSAKTGKVIWKQTIKGAVNTGMGDVAPAVGKGVVVQDTVVNEQIKNGHKTVDTTVQAMSAKTGKILWSHNMGRGPLPPAFKGGMPMIHDGVVYVGTPVNSIYQARNLKTGKLLWTWKVPDAGPAGAGRGAATYYDGALYVSTGPYIYALNPETGRELGKHYVGGRFGIVNPTIVGGTIYLGNSWDWINALPVDAVNPHYKG